MRIFVTGGTGYIGRAVVRRLVLAGHRVTGLVRSAERGSQLSALGATGLVGDLKLPASYAEVAAEHDGLVHIGFENGEAAVPTDRVAVETLIEAARAGAARSLVYTSGVLVLGRAGPTPAYEDASTAGALLNTWRPAHEQRVLAAATPTLSTAVLRPAWVYGGEAGLLADYFETAVKEGAAAYVGDGRNRLQLVHREDLAELYRQLLERRAAGIFHALDGGTGRIAEYAAAASRAAGRGGATRSIPVEEARRTMGPFADALCLDQLVGSRRAEDLGWRPRRPFLESADQAFADWQGSRKGS